MLDTCGIHAGYMPNTHRIRISGDSSGASSAAAAELIEASVWIAACVGARWLQRIRESSENRKGEFSF
jgi:hypothetical protein